MSLPNEATRAQIQAAQPILSTWLSANAGSGKTRVLTDRVARALLRGVPPQNILCLTFTKAAAAEMQNRLFARLGKWSMLDDPALAAALSDIGENAVGAVENLPRARRLFARAIETPGGLKIQTIHSFCASILRRFPLEAGVPPGFTELEEAMARQRLTEALDNVAENHPDDFDAFAGLFTGLEMEGFAAGLARQRTAYAQPADRTTILAALDLPAGYTRTRMLEETLCGGERDLLRRLVPYLQAGSSTDARAGAELSALPDDDMSLLALLDRRCVTQSGKNAGQPKVGSFPTKATQKALPEDLLEQLDALMLRLGEAHDLAKRLDLAERSHALHRFAQAFLPAYAEAKARRGELDFDDLILKTKELLTRPGVAEWVLFRLDGGIDHILVDEAQDTAPVQWEVIDLLSREITAGSGTREAGERTIFVVGDKKQSIYGFQGADPDGFERMADTFSDRLGQLGAAPQRMELLYSFRSAAPILRLVDAAFPDAPHAMGGALQHIAFHETMPGRVDLWPFIDKKDEQDEEAEPWFVPVDMTSAQDPSVQLGRRIAAEIQRIKAEERLFEPDGEGYRPRRIHDGDFLILVQRRATVFHEVIRACKAAGLSVAGADRVALGEALAVKDVLALLAFLSTPEDDLALASALRSPLFDWSEDAIYRLAAPRAGRTLWQALREQGERAEPARSILSELLNRADFERPFELIDRILRQHDGRARLLTRLGIEVEDSIDLLLTTALNYEQAETPSLTGFLAWLESGNIEIKRGAEGSGRAIRIMTVHGAKGLESPIVILAESGDRRPPREDGPVKLRRDMPPLWKPAKANTPAALRADFDTLAEKQEEERLRLQYVAMTRAEQWLIVCGAGTVKQEKNWYLRTEDAMARVGAVNHSFSFGAGLRYENGRETPLDEQPSAAISTDKVEIPAFARLPVATPPRSAQVIAPSSLPGPKTLPAEGEGDPDAMQRGTTLHMLLEHLPEFPPGDREAQARRLLEAVQVVGDVDALAQEALAVLSSPGTFEIFDQPARSEVWINASLPELGGRPVQGMVDRLIVSGNCVTAVDYKTNAVIPVQPRDTPTGLLAQMGAYASALRQIYPDHEVRTAILWTHAPRLDLLPHDLVTNALRSSPLP